MSLTVLLMSQCKRIFADIFVTSRLIKLKLTLVIWRFKTNADAKFQLVSTTNDEFPNRPPLLSNNCTLSATLWRCRKRAFFTIGVYVDIIYPLSDLNEISPQSSSKTFKWLRWDFSLIERDVTKKSPKICLHWDMRRTVHLYFTWKHCTCTVHFI